MACVAEGKDFLGLVVGGGFGGGGAGVKELDGGVPRAGDEGLWTIVSACRAITEGRSESVLVSVL